MNIMENVVVETLIGATRILIVRQVRLIPIVTCMAGVQVMNVCMIWIVNS